MLTAATQTNCEKGWSHFKAEVLKDWAVSHLVLGRTERQCFFFFIDYQSGRLLFRKKNAPR